MKAIRTFAELRQQVEACPKHPRVVAVRPTDEATKETLRQIQENHLAEVIAVDAPTPEEAAAQAVSLVRNGEGDILMKGLIGTDQLLRAVLNKETGLLPPGRILTHIAAAEIPGFHKMLYFTDAAVIPYPTHEQRIEQVRYAADICRKLGISEPRIALIHCAEHGGKQFPFVDGYANIIELAGNGAFGLCLVDGPMDIKSACSLEALQAKGLTSTLMGEADVLVMPDIEAGNAFYKSLPLFAHAKTAGILCGTSCPVVVPSRGDSSEAKFNSILFAIASL